jgi:hypothetical protein
MADDDDVLGLANTHAEEYAISMNKIATIQNELNTLDE